MYSLRISYSIFYYIIAQLFLFPLLSNFMFFLSLKNNSNNEKKHWKPWCVFCVGQHHLCIHPCWIVFDNSTIPLNISPPKKLSVANNSLAIGGTLHPLHLLHAGIFFFCLECMSALCMLSVTVFVFISLSTLLGLENAIFLKLFAPSSS